MTRAHHTDEVPADLVARFPEVTGVGGSPPGGPEASVDLSRLHAMLDDEGPLDRVGSLSTPMRWGVCAGLLLAFVALVLAATRRPDLGVLPVGRLALDLGLLIAPLVLALVVALRPLSRPAVPRALRIVAVALGVLGVSAMLALPSAHALHPASVPASGALFWKQVGSCLGFGIVFSMIAGFAVGAVSRNGVRRWAPGAVGLSAAGLMGLVALYLHCPITDHGHLWAGHATVLVPVLALAWAVRRRLDG